MQYVLPAPDPLAFLGLGYSSRYRQADATRYQSKEPSRVFLSSGISSDKICLLFGERNLIYWEREGKQRQETYTSKPSGKP